MLAFGEASGGRTLELRSPRQVLLGRASEGDVSLFDPFLEDRHIYAALQHHLPIPFAFVRQAVERTGVSPAEPFEVFRDRFAD